MNDAVENDYLSVDPEEPNLPELKADYDLSFNSDRYNSMGKLDDIRFARWSGQTDDGKKHDQDGLQAFPWEGASDCRENLVDEVSNFQGDILLAAFNRAEVKVEGVEVSDIEGAGARQTLFRWLKNNAMFGSIQTEAELLAQYASQYGYGILHSRYVQKNCLRLEEVTFAGLEALAQSLAEVGDTSLIQSLPADVQNKEADDQTAEILLQVFPFLKKRRALQVVRDLRETGRAEFPRPYVSVSRPEIIALKPMVDVVFPPETTELKDARVIFRRVWMTETELRAMRVSEGWDEDWIEEAIKHAGKTYSPIEDISGSAGSGDMFISGGDFTRKDNLIEVVYAYAKRLNEDDIPGVYCTIFHPMVVGADGDEELYAKHELLDYSHGEYPFIEYRNEVIDRRVQESRSVGDIASTWQNEIKVQHDSIFDNTSLGTVPPILVHTEDAINHVFGPGVKVPVRPGREPKYMSPPPFPNQAALVLEMVEKKVNRYFGRTNKGEDPTPAQLKQERAVNRWLHAWTMAFSQCIQLFIQYAPDGMYERITGTTKGMDLSQNYDYLMKMDPRDLDAQYVQEKYKALANFIIPLDQGAVIDRTKLVKMGLQSIDPTLADELVMDNQTAMQKVMEEVDNNLMRIALGNEAMYTENDPAAQMKLQVVEQRMQANQKYQQMMAQDESFQALLQNYVKNLQMSISQQQNKQIGRTGVEPMQ